MIEYYDVCEKGGREQNQDSVLCLSKGDSFLFSVADGLGGYADSRLASLFVHEVLRELFLNDYRPVTKRDGQMSSDVDTDEVFLKHAVEVCQDILLEYKDKTNIHDSYTTLVLLLITGNKARWCHVGDSRLYYFKNNIIEDMTLDHSVPRMLCNAGMLQEDQIRKHPDRGKLLRAIGRSDKELKIDISGSHEISTGDAFLLCSDGLWEYVTEQEMTEALVTFSGVKDWVTAMVTNVKDAGMVEKTDNYSAVGVKVT